MFRKKKPTFIIAFDATTQAMATDKFCTKNGLPGRLIPVPRRNYRRLQDLPGKPLQKMKLF